MPVVDQRLDDLARAGRREAPVGGERDHEELAARGRERAREVAAGLARRVEVVERLGDAQVGVRVVVLGELVPLVAQVGLDLELGREAEQQAVAQLSAELRVHLLVGQVGDVPDHPRDAQAAPRLRSGGREVPVVEVGIRQDRLPGHFVERDVLGRQVRCRGNDDRVADAARIADRPVERLHAAEAPSHHRGPALDAEAIGKARLGVDPVLDGDHREVRAPRLAGGRIGGRRSGRAEAAAEVVDPDDVEAIGVERLARTDHVVPPADVALVAFVEAGDVVRRVQRMADQDRIAAVGVERAVGFVGQVERVEGAPAGELQRLGEVGGVRDDRPDRAAAAARTVGSCGRLGKGRHRRCGVRRPPSRSACRAAPRP